MDKVTFGSLFVKVASNDPRTRVLAAITGLRKQAAEQRKAYVKDQVYGIIANTMQKHALLAPVDAVAEANAMGNVAAAKKLTGLALKGKLPPALANAKANKGKAAIDAITKGNIRLPKTRGKSLIAPPLGGKAIGLGVQSILNQGVPAAGAGPQNIPPSK